MTNVSPIRPKTSLQLDPDKLPDVGERRFWRVEHQPKSRATPVKVTLLQRMPGTNLNSMATILSYENCIATPESIYEAAEKVAIRALHVDELVGDYEGSTR